LELEHRTGARGLGVSRTVRDDERVLRLVLRPRLDPLVVHLDRVLCDHVADAAPRVDDDRSLAGSATALHLVRSDSASDLGIEGWRRLSRAEQPCEAACD